MGLSVNQFTYAGVDEFDLNFAMGYTSRSDVNCVKSGEIPEVIEFDWLTDTRVRVVSSTLSLGDELTFYRTVSKNALPVDLNQPGASTREALEVNSRHAVMIAHEILDGRFSEYTEVTASVSEIVSNAVANSIEASGLLARYKYPVLLQHTGVEQSWPISNMVAGTAELMVHVVTAPLSDEEILITGANGVVASVLVDTAGETTITLYPVDTGELITVSSVQSNGAVVHMNLSGVLEDYLEFAEEYPDWAEQYRSFSCP